MAIAFPPTSISISREHEGNSVLTSPSFGPNLTNPSALFPKGALQKSPDLKRYLDTWLPTARRQGEINTRA